MDSCCGFSMAFFDILFVYQKCLAYMCLYLKQMNKLLWKTLIVSLEHVDFVDLFSVCVSQDLDRSLKDVLVNTITSEQISDILHTLEIDENTKIDFKLFAGLAAYAERVLYPKFVYVETYWTIYVLYLWPFSLVLLLFTSLRCIP